MSYTPSHFNMQRQKTKLQQKKIATRAAQPPQIRNSTNKHKPADAPEVPTTVPEAQRANREAAKHRKRTALRTASGFAIGLHALTLILLTVYFVQKKVIAMNDEKIQTVIMQPSKQQSKRRTPPRETRRAQKPKSIQIRALKTQPVSTNAKIPIGNAQFTLPTSNVATRHAVPNSTTGIGTKISSPSRQVNSVATIPKFETPKFENTSLGMKIDTGTSLAQTEFNIPDNLELTSVNLGSTKQSFNDFLKAIRERIKQAQRFPPHVRNLDAQAIAKVQFTLFRDGTIQNPEITNSSGSRALDSAALTAVQNGAPYPPFPQGQEGTSLRLELPIIFQLTTN